MTTRLPGTNIEIGPRRYQVGTNGSWTLTVYQDGIMACTCPDAVIRRHQCKHQIAFVNGEVTSKPRIRATVRVAPPKPVRQWSQSTIDTLHNLDV